ncbi:hypothetical protein HYT24_03420 [Candidatus Pacearchaeota archaeon]|nr:hypothetical protein [Candidatus Pacearchaeota archaeon]
METYYEPQRERRSQVDAAYEHVRREVPILYNMNDSLDKFIEGKRRLAESLLKIAGEE